MNRIEQRLFIRIGKLSWESWLIRSPHTRKIPSSSLGESINMENDRSICFCCQFEGESMENDRIIFFVAFPVVRKFLRLSDFLMGSRQNFSDRFLILSLLIVYF